MELLFSYGTLRRTEVQLRLFGRELDGKPDALPGYRILQTLIEDKDFISKGENPVQNTLVPTGICADFVEGEVFELSTAELALADKYEPRDYRRISVKLNSGKAAWIYLKGE